MNQVSLIADAVHRPALQLRVAERLRQNSQEWLVRPMILLGIADTQLRASVASALTGLECDVVALGDGFHVIERMADAILGGSRQARPCLIIVDSILPGCTGLSLLAGLRELGWDTPVILLMSHDDEDVRRQAWEHGATGVFMNPFAVQELCVFADLVLDLSVGTRVPSPPVPVREWRTHAERPDQEISVVGFSDSEHLGGATANG